MIDVKKQQENLDQLINSFKEVQTEYKGAVLIAIDQAGNPTVAYTLNWLDLGLAAATIQAEFTKHYW